MNGKGGIKEFGWKSTKPTISHEYLLPVILKAINKIQKSGNLADNSNVFDAGCGNGYTSGILIQNGFRVTGVDVSEQGIVLARGKYPQGHFEVASVYDELAAKFGNDFDLVLSTEVVEHLYDPRLFMRNLFSLLRPGGHLILSTPYHGYLKNLVLVLSGKMDNHFSALDDGGHIKFWSNSTMKLLLEDVGFSLLKFWGAGRLPYLWKSMVVLAKKPSSDDLRFKSRR
jgi:2-polyprenyl-3-methyl-5-hydroxy-6-metoxy-1,4-benzoquinol methylase